MRLQRLKVSNLSDLNDPFELLSIDMSDKSQRDYFAKVKKEATKILRLLCLSSTRKDPLMWSHYGDRHAGVVLELEVNESLVSKVKYLKNRQVFDPKKHSSKFDYKLFTTKYSGWVYEMEQRIFLRLEDIYREKKLDFYSFNEDVKLVGILSGPLSKLTRAMISKNLPIDKFIKFTKTRLAYKSFSVVWHQGHKQKIVRGKAALV